MSSGDSETMINGLEVLREGVTSMLREIDRLKAENEALKGYVVELQEQVEQAKQYIEACAAITTVTSDDRDGRAARILPHDRAAEQAPEGRKKKGGI